MQKHLRKIYRISASMSLVFEQRCTSLSAVIYIITYYIYTHTHTHAYLRFAWGQGTNTDATRWHCVCHHHRWGLVPDTGVQLLLARNTHWDWFSWPKCGWTVSRHHLHFLSYHKVPGIVPSLFKKKFDLGSRGLSCSTQDLFIVACELLVVCEI